MTYYGRKIERNYNFMHMYSKQPRNKPNIPYCQTTQQQTHGFILEICSLLTII